MLQQDLFGRTVRRELEHQTQRTISEIALDLLDQMHAEGLPYRAGVADPGSGISVESRCGLDERGVVYMVSTAGNEAVRDSLERSA